MRLDYIINLDSYTWFCVHVIWILDLKARDEPLRWFAFQGNPGRKVSEISMGSGTSLKDFILLRLWWRPFPAEILDQSYPSSRPHTAKHFSAGTELSGAVQHMLMVLVIRDDFNDTLMTNSIMVSVHVLQTRHCLMGYSLLCTAIAVVPYLPSSLAPASFSFHYCLHSFADPCAPHSKHFQPGSSRLWSPPGVTQPLGWGCGKLLSSASLSSGRARGHRNRESSCHGLGCTHVHMEHLSE